MKKLLCLSMAALMVLAVSCGKDNKPGNTVEPELERIFFTKLVKLGFHVKLETNDRG